MKSLVVYSSQSGNTRKMAEAAFEVLPEPKEIHPVEAAPDPAAYDFVVMGFWLKAGNPDPKSQEFLKKTAGSRLFLFSTHGAAAGSEHAKRAMDAAKSLAQGAEIVGTFDCQGAVNPELLAKVKARPNPPEWIDDADTAVGHPDARDVTALQEKIKEALDR